MKKNQTKQITFKEEIYIILQFVKPYKALVFFIFLMLMVASILEAIGIGSFYPLINQILNSQSNNIIDAGNILYFLSFLVEKLSIDNKLIAACVFLAAVISLSNIWGFLADTLTTWFRYKLFEEYLNKTLGKLVSNQYRFFLEKKQGDLLYIGTNASQSVGEMLLYFPKVGVETFRIISILILLISISPKLTVSLVGISVLFAGIIHYVSIKVIAPNAVKYQEAFSELTSIFNEFIAGIRQIKISDFIQATLKRYFIQTKRVRQVQTINVISSGSLPKLSQIIAVLFVSSSLIYIDVFHPNKFSSLLAILGIYVVALQKLMGAVAQIGHHWMGLKNLSPRLKLVYDTLVDQSYHDTDGDKELKTLASDISLKEVCFSYPSRKDVLSDISITIPNGKTVAIVGESGSGKSTLVDLIMRLYEPQSGKIRVNSENYLRFTNRSWLSKIGMVSQDAFIYHSTVLDNIRMGKPDATEEEIIESAKVANAYHFIKELPEGFNTILGDRGVKLSGGQRQRVAIARAVIKKPELLILDEATSALDNVSEKLVQQAIREVTKKCTSIVVAHRLTTIEYADKIIVLNKGRKAEEGTHEELMLLKRHYYRLYQSQIEEKTRNKQKK